MMKLMGVILLHGCDNMYVSKRARDSVVRFKSSPQIAGNYVWWPEWGMYHGNWLNYSIWYIHL